MKMRQYIAFVLVLSLIFGQLNQLHQHHHDEQQPAKHIYSDCSLTEDCSICDANQSPSLKPSILRPHCFSLFTELEIEYQPQQCEVLIADSKNKSPPLG
jgi:hypothetical protein